VIPKNTNTTTQGLQATPILKRTPWFANAKMACALQAHVVTRKFWMDAAGIMLMLFELEYWIGWKHATC
jgi:hypothetical protein